MFTYSTSFILDTMTQPLLLIGLGTGLSIYFEKKGWAGLSTIATIGALIAFTFLWLFPVLDQISYMFTGVLAIR